MKTIKWVLVSACYVVVFCLLTFISMIIINSIVSDENILRLAKFWGIYGIEEIIDLYLLTSFIISSIISLFVIYICYKWVQR
ncbi:hypothetical protein RAVI111496_14200 [Rahnella victoriana]